MYKQLANFYLHSIGVSDGELADQVEVPELTEVLKKSHLRVSFCFSHTHYALLVNLSSSHMSFMTRMCYQGQKATIALSPQAASRYGCRGRPKIDTGAQDELGNAHELFLFQVPRRTADYQKLKSARKQLRLRKKRSQRKKRWKPLCRTCEMHYIFTHALLLFFS